MVMSGRTLAVMFHVIDWKCELTPFKLLALVTSLPFVVSGCTAEPQDEVPSQTSPASEAMRDPVEPRTPAANAKALDAPQASSTTETAVLAVEGEGIRFFNPITTGATPIPFGRPQPDPDLQVGGDYPGTDDCTGLRG